MEPDFIFQIVILIMSVVVHEVSHGYAASLLGDETARYQGRLTLNPAKHLDPVGSFLVPGLSYLLGGFIIGWAKPVPYNPHNLRPGRWSEALVALAGPASNLAIATIFGLLLRFSLDLGLGRGFFEIMTVIVFINLVLAIFNLVPIPPLDGSKVLYAFFPAKFRQLRDFFERYGFMLVLLFIFFLWRFIFPIALGLFELITGFLPM
jgi:Zn-dependent protease